MECEIVKQPAPPLDGQVDLFPLQRFAGTRSPGEAFASRARPAIGTAQ